MSEPSEPIVPQSPEVERERYLREVRQAIQDAAAHEAIDLRDVIAELDSDN